MRYYDLSLRDYSTCVKALCNKAKLLNINKKHLEAIQVFNQVIQLDMTQTDAYCEIADIYHSKLHDDATALQFYQTALKFDGYTSGYPYVMMASLQLNKAKNSRKMIKVLEYKQILTEQAVKLLIDKMKEFLHDEKLFEMNTQQLIENEKQAEQKAIESINTGLHKVLDSKELERLVLLKQMTEKIVNEMDLSEDDVQAIQKQIKMGNVENRFKIRMKNWLQKFVSEANSNNSSNGMKKNVNNGSSGNDEEMHDSKVLICKMANVTIITVNNVAKK